jgi:hypothetical protein
MPLPYLLCVFQLRERGEEKIEPRRSIQGRYISARSPCAALFEWECIPGSAADKITICTQITLLVADIWLVFAAVEFMTRAWVLRK